MTLSKISSRPSTALSRVEPRNKKRSKCGKVTVVSQIPSLYGQHLPHITGENFQTVTNNEIKSGDYLELRKAYEDLLNDQMRNEAFIEQKEKELEEQIREMDDLFQQAEEERKDVEKVIRVHTDAMKMLNDIEVENARVKVRESEQGLEVAQLEDSNREMRMELRSLLDKINDIQNRIERGPDFIKEEIERFQFEADELETENEMLDYGVKEKSAELNDLRIELIMKDSDSENDSDDESEVSSDTNKRPEISVSVDSECITPPLSLPQPDTEEDAPMDLKLNLSNLNDQVILPPIRQRDSHENKPKHCKPLLKAHPVLPSINGVKINGQSTNPSELSRNILHRGTSTVTKMAFLPKPPTSGLPAVAPRRRKIKRS